MKAGRRHVVFVRAPEAAPTAPVSVRMPPAPVLFIKARSASAPAPAHAAAPVEPDDFNWSHPCTGRMVDILVKATHDGFLSARDLSRASDAYMCGRPLPHELIELVVALA